MPIRVGVIEDHPLVLRAVVQDLSAQDDIRVVGTAMHGAELHRLVRETSPDVIILDLGFAGEFEPVGAVKALRQTHPHVQILVLTAYESAVWMRELFTAGVRGYVLKSDDLSLRLPEGVRTVYRGGRFYSLGVTEKLSTCEDAALLTGQEVTVLRQLARGFSNACIGRELGLAENTVRNYCSSIYAKLGVLVDDDVNPRMAAVNKARDLGLLQ
jgi:DNA-binding NarL/FixJ family response regulator